MRMNGMFSTSILCCRKGKKKKYKTGKKIYKTGHTGMVPQGHQLYALLGPTSWRLICLVSCQIRKLSNPHLHRSRCLLKKICPTVFHAKTTDHLHLHHHPLKIYLKHSCVIVELNSDWMTGQKGVK